MADLGEYYAAVPSIAGSGSAQNLVSIENPSGSAVNVLIKNLEITSTSTLTTALAFYYNAVRLSAVPTGGTIQSSQKYVSTNPSSQAIVRTVPTGFTAVAGNYWTGTPGSALIIGIPLTGIAALPGWIGKVLDYSQKATSVILAPGEGFLIKVDANNTSWTHGINLHWFEQDQ